MKNKKGKKLVVLGAMAALLTLIGVSGSQTYAKYVESTTVAGESATVAKWGYVASITGDLFGTMYVKDGTLSKVTTTESAALTIKSLRTTGIEDVVAPGSTGSMSIAVNGVSEVDTRLSIAMPTTVEDIFLYDGTTLVDEIPAKYYPLQWTLSGTNLNVDGNTDTIAVSGTLEKCLNALSNLSATYQAGTRIELNVSLTWQWVYEAAADTKVLNLLTTTNDTDVLDTDEADTILAILANGAEGKGLQYNYTDVIAKYGNSTNSHLDVGFTDFAISLTQVQA